MADSGEDYKTYIERMASESDDWAEWVSRAMDDDVIQFHKIDDQDFINAYFIDAMIISAVNTMVSGAAEDAEVLARLIGVLSAVTQRAKGQTLLERFVGPVDDHIPDDMV